MTINKKIEWVRAIVPAYVLAMLFLHNHKTAIMVLKVYVFLILGYAFITMVRALVSVAKNDFLTDDEVEERNRMRPSKIALIIVMVVLFVLGGVLPEDNPLRFYFGAILFSEIVIGALNQFTRVKTEF